ncbi:MAG: acetyltransferase [Chloroflexia bacterium]|nr:acetyltransferase [Chloroflexia bacterium]
MNLQSVDLRVARRDDAATLENMLNLYLHDLSPFTGATIGRDGRFAYRYLGHYWTTEGEAEGRVPFLITIVGELGGFVLKSGHSHIGQPAPVSNVSEFFVLRGWRGQGVGRVAARSLFDRFPGTWKVAQLRTNVPARIFWLQVIDGYTGHWYTEHDLDTKRWDGFVQTFRSPAGLPA